MAAHNLDEKTATAAVVATGNVAYLYSVSLTGGSDAATAVVRTAGASGTRKVTMAAAAGVSVQWRSEGVLMSDGIHVTLTGTSPLCDVEWTN